MKSLEEIAQETQDELAKTSQITFKFKPRRRKIHCSDFWYDIREYAELEPEHLLTDPSQIAQVRQAITVLTAYQEQAKEQNIVEYV